MFNRGQKPALTKRLISLHFAVGSLNFCKAEISSIYIRLVWVGVFKGDGRLFLLVEQSKTDAHPQIWAKPCKISFATVGIRRVFKAGLTIIGGVECKTKPVWTKLNTRPKLNRKRRI